jgi:predicted acylesterase/phospholipase RssA
MTDRENNKFSIKCLTITGGGHNGFSSAGILRHLYDKLWNYESLESIYSTSSGTLVGIIIALKLNIDDVMEYVLQRPLDSLISFDSSRILSLVSDNGMYGPEIFIDFLKPLFASADIDININLKDFYDIAKIKFNIFTSEVNAFESVVITHENFPELKVVDAIAMSASIPIIFKPICIDNNYYFDGGFFKACPYNDALKIYDSADIIAICERYHFDKDFDNRPKNNTTIANFFMILLSNAMRHFNLKNSGSFIETPTTFIMQSECITPAILYKCKEHSYRKELYDYGITICKEKLLKNESTAECSENESLQ